MADPIERRIMNDLKSTLEGITRENGYNVDIRKVTLKEASFYDFKGSAIWVASSDATKAVKNQTVTDVLQEFTLGVKVRDSEDIELALSYIAADIEKALRVDKSRGGLAIKTDVTANRGHELSEDMKTEAGVFVDLTIHYRHQTGDPYTTIG